jgi:NAD(P)-dependent dehydrogenase (short-subunit alcohol dehydrogenase family)
MSDKSALLPLFDQILSHLAPALLGNPRRLLPLACGWGKLPGMTEGGLHAGRVALVTGAGRGIGAASARLLAGEGAAVAVAARTEEEIASVAREIRAQGGTAFPVDLDVSDEGSVSSCFARVRAELGDVTILVNNAGTPGVPLPVAATQPDAWRRAFDVNITGAFLCARQALPGMASANWGRIVNVSSAAARHPVAGMSAYGASKAALDQLTRVLALEGEPYGIAVTGVYPGVVDTRMQQESRTFGQDLIGKQLHRMFHGYKDFGMLRPPEEPAELISYLCTHAARRLSGHIIRLEQLEAIREGS